MSFYQFEISDYDPKIRYMEGPEWVEVFDLMMTSDEPFDYEGHHFNVKGGICLPKPVQKPRPALMSATFSPDGRAFAVSKCDILFTMLPNSDHVKSALFRSLKYRAGRIMICWRRLRQLAEMIVVCIRPLMRWYVKRVLRPRIIMSITQQ